MKETANTSPGWPRIFILIGVFLFLVALAGSALFIPQLRLLHVLQSLIYILVAVLVMRNSPWGFGAGTLIAIAWNYLSIFVTHLFQAGLREMVVFAHTGHTSRPDTIMVAVGGIAHFVLIIGCVASFFRLGPGKKQWAQFGGGGLVVLAYMVLIVSVAAPR